MTSATTQALPEPESRSGFSSVRQTFRDWRRTRPFWGGGLVLFAGLPIMYFPYNDLAVGTLRIHMATTAGAGALIIGLLMLALGISVWFQPLIRVFAGIAAIVLALVSFPVSNFGGFGLGLFPGLIGGAMVCSWAPLKQPKEAESVAADLAEQPVAQPEPQQPDSMLSELMVPQQQSAEGDSAVGQPAQGQAEPEGDHRGE